MVEVEKDATTKNIDELDIALPRLTRRRFNREFRTWASWIPSPRAASPLARAVHAGGDPRDRLQDHARCGRCGYTIQLDTSGVADFRSVVAFFARQPLKSAGWSRVWEPVPKGQGALSATTCLTSLSILKALVLQEPV